MKSRSALLAALIAILLFSSAPPCMSKVGLNAISLGISRLGLASLGMTVFLALRWTTTRQALQAWNRRTTLALVTLGISFGIHWLLFFSSVKMAGPAIGAISFSTYGIHLVVLGWFVKRKRVTGIELFGLLLAGIGTWLLIPEFSFKNSHTAGLLVGIASGFFAALLPIWHQKYADVDANLRTWGQFAFALCVFLCASPWAVGNLLTDDVPMQLYLGLGITLLGHGLWARSVTALSFTTTSILSYLYLPLSLLESFFMVGEKLTGQDFVGVCFTLAANAIVLISQIRRGAIEA